MNLWPESHLDQDCRLFLFYPCNDFSLLPHDANTNDDDDGGDDADAADVVVDSALGVNRDVHNWGIFPPFVCPTTTENENKMRQMKDRDCQLMQY